MFQNHTTPAVLSAVTLLIVYGFVGGIEISDAAQSQPSVSAAAVR